MGLYISPIVLAPRPSEYAAQASRELKASPECDLSFLAHIRLSLTRRP